MSVTRRELERCAALAQEADHLRERMIRLRADAEEAGEAARSLEQLTARWWLVIDAYLALMGRIDQAIAGLECPAVRTVMRLRYLEGLAWEEVGYRAHYASSHCRRLCCQGLQQLGARR